MSEEYHDDVTSLPIQPVCPEKDLCVVDYTSAFRDRNLEQKCTDAAGVLLLESFSLACENNGVEGTWEFRNLPICVSQDCSEEDRNQINDAASTIFRDVTDAIPGTSCEEVSV